MTTRLLKPSDKPIREYYGALTVLGHQHADHEMAVRSAFQTLLQAATGAFPPPPRLLAAQRRTDVARERGGASPQAPGNRPS